MTDEEIMIQDALNDPDFFNDNIEDDELEEDHGGGPDYDDSFNYDYHEIWAGCEHRPPVKTEL